MSEKLSELETDLRIGEVAVALPILSGWSRPSTHRVSFVSVTQEFNTTSSMGRLTLHPRIAPHVAAEQPVGLARGV
jgi:hypothetical protein